MGLSENISLADFFYDKQKGQGLSLVDNVHGYLKNVDFPVDIRRKYLITGVYFCNDGIQYIDRANFIGFRRTDFIMFCKSHNIVRTVDHRPFYFAFKIIDAAYSNFMVQAANAYKTKIHMYLFQQVNGV